MRVIRRIVATLFLPIVLLVPTVIGTVAAIVFTPPGHALLARVATKWITSAVRGGVEIGEVRGSIWHNIELLRVVIRDSSGGVVLSSSRVQASYVLPELLAHRLVFSDVHVDSLQLHLVQVAAGRWNYEQVFHMGEGPADGAAPPHVALNGLEITDGFVRIDVPTSPRPPHPPISRNARPPARPSIDTIAGHPFRVYTFANLNARLRLLRISTPRRDPLLADILALRVKASDPDLTITQMAGRIVTAKDTLHFSLDSIALPASHLAGSGSVRWPHDTILSDFTLDAPRIALRDLWWIQPDLPDWQGRGQVVARSFGGSRTDYRLDRLQLGDGAASIEGKVTLQVEAVRGLGMRDLDLQLRNTPVGVMRPFLDTLPVAGTLTGHLLADGFLDAMRLGGDLVFADALVPGTPTSHLRPNGVMHFGGAAGAVFEKFRLDQSTLALGTVHQLVPSMVLQGEFHLSGDLNGPWQNADFSGTVEHAAPSGAVSRMNGRVRIDSRASVLGLSLDATFDQLSFAALRSGYPDLAARGGLSGHVIANGNLDALDLTANLSGEIGTFAASGRVRINAPNFGADSLLIQLERLDLQAVTDTGMSTAINGRVVVRGVLDSGRAPSGRLDLALDRSRFGGATVDGVNGIVRADHGMLMVDTGTVIWNTGRVDAHGTFGWAAPDSGTLTLSANATSLTPFDSLVRAITGLTPDTLHRHLLDGQAQLSLRLLGSLDDVTVTGSVDAGNLIIDALHAASVHGTIRADSLGRKGLMLEATVDTVGSGARVADEVHLVASGRPDSLRLAGTVDMVALTGSGGGIWTRDSLGSAVRLDSLSLAFPHQQWQLAGPTRLMSSNGQVTFVDTLRLRSTDGTGDVRVSGTTPGDHAASLDANIRGLDLLDIFGVLQRDSAALDGWGSLELHLAGTRDAPTFKGSASITGPVLGDLHAPSVQATFNYASSRLQSDLSLWKTGQKVLDGKVSLPLDLAFASRQNRKLDGPIEISGTADSVDMVMLATLIPSIENPTGLFSLDVKGSGTWARPVLQGQVSIFNGGMFFPSLNVRYERINGVARFAGDSLAIDSLAIVSGDGRLNLTGGMRFAQLSQPSMNLQLHARNFLAIDQPAKLKLRASGDLTLTGPLLQPVLSGSDVLLTQSVVYFGDLITKNVINLDDPENAALIDLTAVQRERLRNEFSNRFLDSLRVDDLHLRLGAEVWLRSAEANIQVQGDLQVEKTRNVYGLVGTLDTPRGTYTLRIGPINSDFVIDQGSVTYYGAANLDALLNISAHHQVRTLDGDDFNVVAAITGSILEPKVDLSSPGRALSDRDLASYVLFGQSESQLTSNQTSAGAGATNAAIGALTGALASEVQRTLAGGLFTSLTIRPALTPGATSSSASQIAAGLQLGRKWFVTLDAGVCLSQGQSLQKRNFGASLEYRFSREVRLQSAAEPVQTCATNRAADVFTTLSRYQLGLNLLWQRDY